MEKIETKDFIPSEYQVRFSGATWFKKALDVTVEVCGVGGIGSYVSMYLSRIGTPITVRDFDTVERVNMAGQLFPISCVGMTKVRAIEKVCKGFAPESSITLMGERVTESTILQSNIVFSCFDNMTARKVLFDLWLKKCEEVSTSNNPGLFIDGRLAAESYQIYIIPFTDKDRIKTYQEKYLFSDEEMDKTLCSYKQTTHMAAMITSRMVMYFTNYLHNLVDDVPRVIPFIDELDNQDSYFNISK